MPSTTRTTLAACALLLAPACGGEPADQPQPCPAGYTGQQPDCLDIDECALGTHGCDPNATCRNSPGGHGCACRDGYEGDGALCADLDECALALDDCDLHADCLNTDGGWSCTCRAGWEGDGAACADIDECARGLDACHPDADCANNDGGYTCACRAGYDGDGVSCADLDECDLALDDCAIDADCANSIGGYACTCRPGFSGDGRTCTDITHWVLVPDVGAAISLLDTDRGLTHGPFLRGQLGSSGGSLLDAVVTPDGRTALVSNFGDSRVFFVDLRDPTAPAVLGKLELEMFAEDIALSADGRFALVTDGGFSPRLVSLDVERRAIVQTFQQRDVFACSVAIAPDGTVVTTDYFNASAPLHTFWLDQEGQLSYGHGYRWYTLASGAPSDDPDAHLPRPVNAAISPDGTTVLVPDVAYYNHPTALQPDVEDTTGPRLYSLAHYTISAPGELTFQGLVADLPRAVQSLAFERFGTEAYLLGNAGFRREYSHHDGMSEDEQDQVLVLDLSAPGAAALDPLRRADLRRHSMSQLFGVDTITVQRGVIYAGYSTTSVQSLANAGPLLRVVTAIDAQAFTARRIPVHGVFSSLVAIPVTTRVAWVPPAPPTCAGRCATVAGSNAIFYADGANLVAGCFCDHDCQDWDDCCTDYAARCTGCDPDACSDDYTCANSPAGDLACGCPVRYLDGGSGACTPIDYCADGGSDFCRDGATCQDDGAGFVRCLCPPPFTADGSGGCECPRGFADADSDGCTDLDECALGTHSCQGLATCVNRVGGYAALTSDGSHRLVTGRVGGEVRSRSFRAHTIPQIPARLRVQ